MRQCWLRVAPRTKTLRSAPAHAPSSGDGREVAVGCCRGAPAGGGVCRVSVSCRGLKAVPRCSRRRRCVSGPCVPSEAKGGSPLLREKAVVRVSKGTRVSLCCPGYAAVRTAAQNSWAQAIRRAQPPEYLPALGLQAQATLPGSFPGFCRLLDTRVVWALRGHTVAVGN
uniref:Uncharacterized protein n=1 Tax=Amazona collaria TaxID=241587 RepID=A0A8B9FGN2_9PSIT